MCWSRGNLCSVHSWVANARSAKRSAKHSAPSGVADPQPSESGRVPDHHSHSHGRMCWQDGGPRNLWACTAIQVFPCLAKVGERYGCWRQSQPTPRQASLCCSIKKRGAFRLRIPRRNWLQFWTRLGAHVRWRKSSGWAATPVCNASCTRRGLLRRLVTLPREWWCWQVHRSTCSITCGHFRTLRRVIVMIAGPLDEGRIGGSERQHTVMC